ncbi:hypothetical protein OG453_44485 [Streptomyces sp. NBC_01381]|uniref:hypothetical protein n=1 Tax=Streptomyces sp. NBC_01381 TaxID=2903845 RepID=UPI00225BA5B0|nr:hypothetical protein [Streptomyces sp. NBC_01381]MCX4673617.1 hypothetical protein [Streptomyces sp. NBC_01381]
MRPEELLPHAPYIAAVDRELAARGIPPGRLWTYGAAYPGQHATRPAQQRLCALLEWDRSRCTGLGVTWHWGDDTGWRSARTGRGGRRLADTTRPLGPPLYADPVALADVAQALVRGQRPVPCDQVGEWSGAAQVRRAVVAFRGAPPAGA